MCWLLPQQGKIPFISKQWLLVFFCGNSLWLLMHIFLAAWGIPTLGGRLCTSSAFFISIITALFCSELVMICSARHKKCGTDLLWLRCCSNRMVGLGMMLVFILFSFSACLICQPYIFYALFEKTLLSSFLKSKVPSPGNSFVLI